MSVSCPWECRVVYLGLITSHCEVINRNDSIISPICSHHYDIIGLASVLLITGNCVFRSALSEQPRFLGLGLFMSRDELRIERKCLTSNLDDIENRREK